jgi:hypothetical protein
VTVVDPHHTDARETLSPTPGTSGPVAARTMRVVPWPDPVVEALGFDPRSLYAEHFWLPVIGPTATWLLRHLASRLERAGGGFTICLDETARALGLGGSQSRHSPFARAVGRCVTFELARWHDHETLAVRRALPPLARRQLVRLPAALQEAHQRWSASALPAGAVDAQRRRARRLALGLVALGASLDAAEGQLLRWGVHPALTDEAVVWARSLERREIPS